MNICHAIWELSELTGIGLGRFAPFVFGRMIDRKGKQTEQSIIGRWSPTLECTGNRHYWKLIVMLPGEPCNCGSYAYQPDNPSGYSKLEKNG